MLRHFFATSVQLHSQAACAAGATGMAVTAAMLDEYLIVAFPVFNEANKAK